MTRQVRHRRAFTLIELLLAASLASLLMLGILFALNGVVRDARRVSSLQSHRDTWAAFEILRRDLEHAASSPARAAGSMTLLAGNVGINPATRLPNGRLARVSYRIERRGGTSWLLREQVYLDDPIRPMPWPEIIAVGATGFSIEPDRIRIEFGDDAIEQARELK